MPHIGGDGRTVSSAPRHPRISLVPIRVGKVAVSCLVLVFVLAPMASAVPVHRAMAPSHGFAASRTGSFESIFLQRRVSCELSRPRGRLDRWPPPRRLRFPNEFQPVPVWRRFTDPDRSPISRGTEGSNPCPSSGESGTNSSSTLHHLRGRHCCRAQSFQNPEISGLGRNLQHGLPMKFLMNIASRLPPVLKKDRH
jgi:hypothetical protein